MKNEKWTLPNLKLAQKRTKNETKVEKSLFVVFTRQRYTIYSRGFKEQN